MEEERGRKRAFACAIHRRRVQARVAAPKKLNAILYSRPGFKGRGPRRVSCMDAGPAPEINSGVREASRRSKECRGAGGLKGGDQERRGCQFPPPSLVSPRRSSSRGGKSCKASSPASLPGPCERARALCVRGVSGRDECRLSGRLSRALGSLLFCHLGKGGRKAPLSPQ